MFFQKEIEILEHILATFPLTVEEKSAVEQAIIVLKKTKSKFTDKAFDTLKIIANMLSVGEKFFGP